jgi:hypothetical protein
MAAVFGSWRSLEHLEWGFAVLVFVCEAASYVCLWQLDRIALGTGAWFPVATAQLSGNAVGRLVPGAPTPFTVELLHKAGSTPARRPRRSPPRPGCSPPAGLLALLPFTPAASPTSCSAAATTDAIRVRPRLSQTGGG